MKALRRVRRELAPEIALIGFCGAPWTVATYMVAGQGTPDDTGADDLSPSRALLKSSTLVENSIQYLSASSRPARTRYHLLGGVLPPRGVQRFGEP
jgi:uroporphyrinogen decarboxylase